MKRFYKETAVDAGDGGYRVLLDGKPMRTPAKAVLVTPTRVLAEAIAIEWQEVPDKAEINVSHLRLTRLAATAIDRVTVANFLAALVTVYSLMIFAYVLLSLIFSFGVRVPYSRWSDAVLGFLRDVCEPYLRIFRRFIPMIGPLDISPIVALLVLQIVGNFVVSAVHG